MASTTAIECGGVEVLLREYQTGGTGNRLWPASHVLLRYMLQKFGPDELANAEILELGAGTGLVSIALAKAGQLVAFKLISCS